MTKAIIVSEKATAEIKKVVSWYDNERIDLSQKFIKELDYFLDKISKNPEAYKTVTNNIRRCLLKMFPYIIFFTVTKKEIVVLRLRHKKQKQLNRFK